jgi:hypothetical protein
MKDNRGRLHKSPMRGCECSQCLAFRAANPPIDLRFAVAFRRSYGSKIKGRLFWIFNEPRIVTGFYPGGLFLWNPFTGDAFKMKSYRFKRECTKLALPSTSPTAHYSQTRSK